jgi:hypothetical protein
VVDLSLLAEVIQRVAHQPKQLAARDLHHLALSVWSVLLVESV